MHGFASMRIRKYWRMAIPNRYCGELLSELTMELQNYCKKVSKKSIEELERFARGNLKGCLQLICKSLQLYFHSHAVLFLKKSKIIFPHKVKLNYFGDNHIFLYNFLTNE